MTKDLLVGSRVGAGRRVRLHNVLKPSLQERPDGGGWGRRVAILYRLEPGRLLCRHCCDRTYESQLVGELGRAKLHVEKTEACLPASGTRPKGMHHASFQRLTRAYLEALQEQEAVYQERFWPGSSGGGQ